MTENSNAEIWDSATDEIAEIYQPGTFDFLEKKNPDLYGKIQSTEDNVNLFWTKNPDAFRMSINLWKKLMRQAIEEFSHDRIQTMRIKVSTSEVTPKSQIEKKEPPQEYSMNIFEKVREIQGE